MKVGIFMRYYVCFFLLVFLSPNTFAMSGKDTILRTNLLADITGFTGIEYERALSDRTAISIDFWSKPTTVILDGSSATNLRVLWREYEKPNQVGLFYGFGMSWFSATYDENTLLDKHYDALALDFKLGYQARIGDSVVISLTSGFMYFVTPILK